jgi:LysR family hydrogen peroxide-inducible transcriptional activator
MDRRQLECFLAVVDNGSFTAAAHECRITQPALSAQISKLEEKIGHYLFSRDKRRVSLTEAGRQLVPRARRILREIGDTETFFAREMAEEAGQLALACIPTIAPFIVPGAVFRFLKRFPRARVSVTECLTEQVLHLLRDGTVDLGILSPPFADAGLQMKKFMRDPFVVAVHRGSQLAERRTLKIRDLKNQPFVVMQEMHCLGRQIGEICYQHKLTDRIVCYSSQLSTIQEFVAKNLGISMLPHMAAKHDTRREVVYIPLTDTKAARDIVAAWREDSSCSLLTAGFLEILGGATA